MNLSINISKDQKSKKNFLSEISLRKAFFQNSQKIFLTKDFFFFLLYFAGKDEAFLSDEFVKKNQRNWQFGKPCFEEQLNLILFTMVSEFLRNIKFILMKKMLKVIKLMCISISIY